MAFNSNFHQKKYSNSLKNTFYGLCRNETLEKLDNENVNEIIEQLKEKYKVINEEKYIWIIDYLRIEIVKKNISKNDAAIILINVIDPNFEIYYLYDEICNYNELKKEIIKKFSFYDEQIIKLEKKYIKNNNLDKIYGWAYKKVNE